MLSIEKKLFNCELNLCDKNNEDARNHLEILEIQLDKEINSKEAEKLDHHGLKQNKIDLKGKYELLEKEYKNLADNMVDIKKDNMHLVDTLDNTKKQLSYSINDCDE